MKNTLTLLFIFILLFGCGNDSITINNDEGVQKLYSLLEEHIDDNTLLNGSIRMTSKPLENNIDYVYFEYWDTKESDFLNAVWIYTTDEGSVKKDKRQGFRYKEQNAITFGELKKKLLIWSNIANGVNMVKEDKTTYAFKGVGAYETSYYNNTLVEVLTLQFTDKNESKSFSGKRILTNYYDIKIRVRDEMFGYVE